MAAYLSVDYERDLHRAELVLQSGAVQFEPLLTAGEWALLRRDESKLERAIDHRMQPATSVVVLIGRETAMRPWVVYEVAKAWRESRPLVGMCVHGLGDELGRTDIWGANPFLEVGLPNGCTVAHYAPTHCPPGRNPGAVLDSMKSHLATWLAGAYASTSTSLAPTP